MLRRSFFHLQKKNAAAAAFAGGTGSTQGAANKLASDEKFALTAVEYLYEWNPHNDPKKRAKDVQAEQKASEAYDRYMHLLDKNFTKRTDRLVARMNEALDACPDELLEEATLFNSQAPPLGFRLPKQSPPVPGFEAAFGLDVPQLRLGQLEEVPLKRLTDSMHLEAVYANEAERSNRVLTEGRSAGASSSSSGLFDDDDDSSSGGSNLQPPASTFPFVETPEVRSVLKEASDKLEELHGTMRSTVPLTGSSGEEWESNCALQRRALSRQQLILDLSENLELADRYNSEPGFAEKELERRGILPLEEEDAPQEFEVEMSPESNSSNSSSNHTRVLPRPMPEIHYAQLPKYHPFRED